MLKRQRALLSIIREAGRAASRLEVTKWAFLVCQETATRGGPSFFQFLPYKYGPYSFCLHQEASALVRSGMILEVDDRTWQVTAEGAAAAAGVPACVHADVRSVVERFRGKNVRDLLGYVYDRYAWYTVNSQSDPRTERLVAACAVYTAGYQGLLVDGFLDGLLRTGIRRLIDVRNNPVARRYGFHKGTLSRLCRHIGIEYAHFPELGIVSAQRQGLDGPAAYDALFAQYERVTLRQQAHTIDRVAALVAQAPSVLVCMEADASQCHRSRLASAVSKAVSLPVQHLEFTA